MREISIHQNLQSAYHSLGIVSVSYNTSDVVMNSLFVEKCFHPSVFYSLSGSILTFLSLRPDRSISLKPLIIEPWNLCKGYSTSFSSKMSSYRRKKTVRFGCLSYRTVFLTSVRRHFWRKYEYLYLTSTTIKCKTIIMGNIQYVCK